MNSNLDQISRSDLALVLSGAAELQARRWEDDAISIAEAERIASEVGIRPSEFRAALRALHASRTGGSGILGPDAIFSVESVLAGGTDARGAARMLTQAHLSLPVSAPVESPAAGTWRTASRTTLLQVTSDGGRTSIAAVLNRRLSKYGLIGGGTWLGTVAGVIVLPSLALAVGGSVEAVAIAQAAGVVGGAGAGFWAGRAAWVQSARRAHGHVLVAVDRMRAVVEARSIGEGTVQEEEGLS